LALGTGTASFPCHRETTLTYTSRAQGYAARTQGPQAMAALPMQ
jgi:hypothetical protein